MNESLTLRSRLYCGQVRHRRFIPVTHELNYSLFMLGIDLDELPQLEQTLWGFGQRWWHWARWRRQDYLGTGDLKTCVQQKVAELTGEHVTGRVVAVCHLRYLGLYFSPVNFYYLYDEQGSWRYLLAEVSNTPWNERHYYAINASAGANHCHWQHAKAFHVSPFNPIEQQYHWRLKPLGKHLSVSLACHQDEKHFDATLAMSGTELTSRRLLKQLAKVPVQTLKVMLGIYWHALKLWIKGAPFYPHPNTASLAPSSHEAEIEPNQLKTKNKQNPSLLEKDDDSTRGNSGC
ncbi:DUF1365 domain-containing protein [Vibrio sp. SM6]|uniref:DUF1365 domain-containing protein n=1 Tax=Vibrio agarilyticus TaxID=2726741 RepID=A0A7X8TMF7_9VIBR|nr:DUF1365 family protein [Vibrio agarilyticus]NLS11457.1 DUF1365 domain-containing protein [Vibrio agarilyticus]